MARSLKAPLSPHEENTLRRIALGMSGSDNLPSANVMRLMNLALIEQSDADDFRLTPEGRQRLRALDGLGSVEDCGSSPELSDLTDVRTAS